METLTNILSRKTVRDYLDKDVSDEDIKKILTAGMSGPSAVNCKPWEFIVTKDKAILSAMSDANGPYARPLKKAAFGILVVGDTDKGYGGVEGYWFIDCAIAAQNMILAAHDLGIGSVWLGSYPEMDRVENLKHLFKLPENMLPHALLSFGYPAKDNEKLRDQYDESKVHFDKW